MCAIPRTFRNVGKCLHLLVFGSGIQDNPECYTEALLMVSLCKSYVTVEHSLNSAGRHRMGNKLSTKKLENGIKH